MHSFTFTSRILAFALLLLPAFSQAQTRVDALFLGNSYTDVNNLPQLIADIATSFGDTLIFDKNVPGGYTFELHSTNATSLAKIAQQPWDYVVLQEQSQRPSFSPSQVAAEVYPFADTLVRKIRENDSCTTPLFYMTWGRKNGDASNCAFYPPVCTYEGMSGRLRSSYLAMGTMFDAQVSPVGSAWWRTRLDQPTIELYQADESHPSLAGSYLAACCFYSSMFHKSCIGASVPAGLDPTQAGLLQQIANATVWDSMSTWRLDTSALMAAFTFVDQGTGLVNFSSTSTGADSHWWDFGDGSSGTGGANPSHLYMASGTYPVTLIVHRTCESDTVTDSVTVLLLSSETPEAPAVQIVPNPSNGNFQLTGLNENCSNLVLSDMGGRIITAKPVTGETAVFSGLAPGIYLLQVTGREGEILSTLRVAVE